MSSRSLIFPLPATEADKAQEGSKCADNDPGNDSEAPAEALGDESNAVGGNGASYIGAGVDNARCR